MGHHLPYGITQCYLLPDTSEGQLAGRYFIYLPLGIEDFTQRNITHKVYGHRRYHMQRSNRFTFLELLWVRLGPKSKLLTILASGLSDVLPVDQSTAFKAHKVPTSCNFSASSRARFEFISFRRRFASSSSSRSASLRFSYCNA